MKESLLLEWKYTTHLYRVLLGTSHVWLFMGDDKWEYLSGLEPYDLKWKTKGSRFVSRKKADQFLKDHMLDML